MKGYLLNFFKYSPIGKEVCDEAFTNNHSEEFVRSVVWSNFDRLEIREIDKFEQFRISQFSEKNWIGERQFAMIYEVDENEKRIEYFKDNKDKCLFAFRKKTEDIVADNKNLRFFGISMVDLTSEMYNYFYSCKQPGLTMHRELLNALDKIVESNGINPQNICFDVYGGLGGNDLIIIWLAYQFEDIVKAIEALRKSSIKNTKRGICANISTIMGIRDMNNPEEDYSDVNGYLNIRLTKKEGYNHREFKNCLEKYLNESDIKFDTIVGEHDLSFRIQGKDLACGLYKEDGFIHIRNKKFSENIIQANTELAVNIDYDSLVTYSFDISTTSEGMIITKSERQKILDYISKIVESQVLEKAPYLKETLWILYEDYLKIISSTFSYPWINDLHFLFLESLTYMDKLIESDSKKVGNKLKYDCIELIVGSLRQMVLHVAQANRLFFEIPNTQLKHTGSYSKILRAYQGIIKQILKLAYSIPKVSSQSQLVPFITFDVTPIAKSEACPNINNCKNKILAIKLPYEALIDIPKYTYLLAHEIYHYVAPKNRKKRNGLLGAIIISVIITQLIILYLDNYIKPKLTSLNNIKITKDDWKHIYKVVKEHFDNHVLSYVINNYEEIIKCIENYNADAEWEIYYRSLWESLGRRLHTNSEFIKTIYFLIDNNNYADIELENLSDVQNNIYQKLIDIIKIEVNEYGIEGFKNWIKLNHPNERFTDQPYDVQYALREAMADFFMIQAAQINCQTYLNQILHYKNIISGGQDFKQIYRLGMVLDFIFNKQVGFIQEESKQEKKVKLKNYLEKEFNFDGNEVDYIVKSYSQYKSALSAYDSAMSLCFKSLNFDTIDEEYYPEFISILKETRECLTSKTSGFETNISFIEKFQKQDDFQTYQKYTKRIPAEVETNIFGDLKIEKYENVVSINDSKKEKIAHSVETLLKQIYSASLEITDDESMNPIWFRGHKDSSYKLIPSLYRMKDQENKFYKAKLREVFESLYNAFRVKAFGATEIYTEGNNSIIGTMTSMQHYSVPTNILDWTTSAFVALYFAVEDKMVFCQSDKKKRSPAEKNADIWLLNPIRLNIAYQYLKGSVNEQDVESINKSYPIPSLFGNEKEYQEFIPFAKGEINKFPVAVYVPHVNQRIKAQVGTFTMFSLDVKGQECLEDKQSTSFLKYDLSEMQERYKKLSKERYKPFLTRVTISKSIICDVADWLRNMGVNRPDIYPELSNISASLTEQIKTYLEETGK